MTASDSGTTARTPERVALDLHAKLKRAEENGRAMRDVIASMVDGPETKPATMRGSLRLLVKAYDEAMAAP